MNKSLDSAYLIKDCDNFKLLAKYLNLNANQAVFYFYYGKKLNNYSWTAVKPIQLTTTINFEEKTLDSLKLFQLFAEKSVGKHKVIVLYYDEPFPHKYSHPAMRMFNTSLLKRL